MSDQLPNTPEADGAPARSSRSTAGVYDSADKPARSTVGVYDAPERGASRLPMLIILLVVVVVLVAGVVIWLM